jgi:DNA-directed RNA polymerase subunit RPC12/RpoP
MNNMKNQGQGVGKGLGRGGGKGRNKGGAMGPGGSCVCTKCGYKAPHQQGIKCTTIKCPECGHTLIREELLKN